jgi:hypothetical protein
MNASNHDPLFTLHYPQDGKHYEEDKENLPPNMKILSQAPPKQLTKTAYSPTAALSNNNNTIADENKSPKVNNEAVMAAKMISPRSPAVYSSVSAYSSGPSPRTGGYPHLHTASPSSQKNSSDWNKLFSPTSFRQSNRRISKDSDLESGLVSPRSSVSSIVETFYCR